MNLEDIQPFLADRIAESPNLAGVPVIKEDGTYPKTPLREESLRTKGLLIIVWQIEPGSLDESSPTGAASAGVYIPVIIEENVRVNRDSSGTGITAEAAMRHVIGAATGRPDPRQGGNRAFRLMDPWFKNFGCTNGVQRMIVNLLLPITLIPDTHE